MDGKENFVNIFTAEETEAAMAARIRERRAELGLPIDEPCDFAALESMVAELRACARAFGEHAEALRRATA